MFRPFLIALFVTSDLAFAASARLIRIHDGVGTWAEVSLRSAIETGTKNNY